MANGVQWIKLSTDVFDNKKIKQIEAMPEGDAILIIWFKLLILAGKTNDYGMVYFTEDIPYTEDMLAVEFAKPIQVVRLALTTFARFGMIEIVDDIMKLSGWEKYQNTEGLERIREQNRERKRRQREREKLKQNAEKSLPAPNLSEDPLKELFAGYDITVDQIDILMDKLKDCTAHLKCIDPEDDYWRLVDEMSELITLSKERGAKHLFPWLKAVIPTTDFQRTGPDYRRNT